MGYRLLRVNHYSLKQQPLHGHTTPGSCMTIRIRGLPAPFGISKPIAERVTTAFAGTPVVHGREPVPPSGAVHRSTHHPLGTGCRQRQARREHQRRGTRAQYHSLAKVVLRRGGYQPVRTRSCVKEKCSFKSKGMVNPVVIPKCVARSSRNCCEEVTGGTSLVHHEAVEMAREVARGACPRDLLHAQEYPVLDGLPEIGEGGILGPGPR